MARSSLARTGYGPVPHLYRTVFFHRFWVSERALRMEAIGGVICFGISQMVNKSGLEAMRGEECMYVCLPCVAY